MKTIFQAALIGICALGMVTAQAQTPVSDVPANFQSLGPLDPTEYAKLPASVKAQAVVKDGQVYVPKGAVVGEYSDYGVAAGAANSAQGAAAGSTAVIIALATGAFAVIGAIVAGSTNNGTTATVTTTNTH